MVWHVGLPGGVGRDLLRLGLHNHMLSAYSHFRKNARMTSWKVGYVRASGGRIFVDSGALSALRQKPAELAWVDRQADIAALAKSIGADYVSHLDVPMERRGLANAGLTHRQALEITVRNARAFLDMDTGTAEKVYVVQGWSIDEFHDCLRRFADLGILDGDAHLGLGSVCMRKPTRGLWQIAQEVREATRGRWLHAFGVGDTEKLPRLAQLGFDSVDEGNTVRAVIYDSPNLPHLLEVYRAYDA